MKTEPVVLFIFYYYLILGLEAESRVAQIGSELFKIYFIIFYVYWCFTCIYYVPHTSRTHRDQEGASDFLELELG